ncbi:MAG: DUF3426 domain-containing protein [Pseudomonadota bacterium]
MSLATRCTSCGTIFKVVQDQLKVSEGWVRCGRCQQVFNALEGLFDLERDAPPQRRTELPTPPVPQSGEAHAPSPLQRRSGPATAGAQEPTAEPPQAAVGIPAATPLAAQSSAPQSSTPAALSGSDASVDWTDVPATHEDDALDSRWLVRPARDGRSARERHARHDPDSDFTDARFPLDAALDDLDAGNGAAPDADGNPRPMPPIPQPASAKRTVLGRTRDKSRKDGAETPAFLKRAKRQAQWRHPAVRVTLSLTALALLALLGLQASIAFRDWIVAYRPDAKPLIAGLCQVAGCEVQPLRRIDLLSVDSVTLVRSPSTAEADHAYRMTVGIHNGAGVALAAPHLELTLTDADGQLVSRRVLAPGDLALPATTLPAQASTAVHARVIAAGPRVAGYTVELFYP